MIRHGVKKGPQVDFQAFHKRISSSNPNGSRGSLGLTDKLTSLGELTMKRLRVEAETELGNDFDIREFHDVVLRHGSIPLHVLEQKVRNYIAETLNQRASN